MKYLVSTRTKEHVWYSQHDCLKGKPGECWQIVQADSEGWIKHDGGECPLPDDARFELWLKGGRPFVPNYPHNYFWSERLSYRPILEDKPQPAPAPNYDPRSVSFNLLDRLAAAHQSASEIPDLVEQLRAQLEPLGLGVMYLSQFDEVEQY